MVEVGGHVIRELLWELLPIRLPEVSGSNPAPATNVSPGGYTPGLTELPGRSRRCCVRICVHPSALSPG